MPFRRFKDTLGRWPGELERWHGYHEDRQRGRARDWLADAGHTVAPPAPLGLTPTRRPVGSDIDDVETACSSQVDKMATVAGDAGALAAQRAFHDTGIDDAVWCGG